MKYRRLFQWAATLAILLVCPYAPAQTTIEPPTVNPGARSLALGGAFVALADDATAAFANPSGLMQLVRSEISVELRTWADDRDGLASDLSGIGFASFVLPRDRWSLAVYGQTLTSLEASGGSSWTGGSFIPLSSLTIANLGVSGAFRISDTLSLGLGVGMYVGNSTEVGVELPIDLEAFSTDDTNIDPGFILGGLWSLNDAWALGASFRSGSDFRFENGRHASLPDVLAVGARWRSAGGHATIAVEVERLAGVDDRTRLHLGGEWVFLSSKPLFGLRAGLWHDPDGSIAGRVTDDAPPAEDGVMHASAGIGVAFKRFQIDLGVDSSDRTTIGAISAIFTF
jgi:long-subunit fatty acid transport protein